MSLFVNENTILYDRLNLLVGGVLVLFGEVFIL